VRTTRIPDYAGREWLEADEVAADAGRFGWVSRDAFPDEPEAEAFARSQIVGPPERLALSPVLMRGESAVEAEINGHEFPMYVECTTRAKKPMPYWRVELAA
jgi:hypothetical protein